LLLARLGLLYRRREAPPGSHSMSIETASPIEN
jgi:hypothetical protein